ncbi:hypothetical protein V8C34DRAFT_279074 [Trichoderma compactum]
MTHALMQLSSQGGLRIYVSTHRPALTHTSYTVSSTSRLLINTSVTLVTFNLFFFLSHSSNVCLHVMQVTRTFRKHSHIDAI